MIASIDVVAACLDQAKAAHEHHNSAALTIAVRIMRGRPDLAWPGWIATAVIDALENEKVSPSPKGGRHARALTQWKEDAADYVRYRAVELLTGETMKRGFYKQVEQALAREALGSGGVTADEAIKDAHERVIERTSDQGQEWNACQLRFAHRYFPDVVTLQLLGAIDVVRNAEKTP